MAETNSKPGQLLRTARSKTGMILLLVSGAIAAFFLVRLLLPPSVDVVLLAKRPVVETLVTTGRVQSVSRTSLGAEVGSTVNRVLVREGARVAKGELLIELDDSETSAAAAGARARLAEAQAALQRITSVTLPNSSAEREAVEVEVRQRARDAERSRVLFDAGAISRTDLEEAERLLESAQARVTAARTAARSAASGGADRRAAEATVQAARAEVEAADARIERMRVRAPASGTVLIRSVEPGDAVTPGAVLMEIALDGPTELLIFPDERVLSRLRPGLPAVVSADAYPDQRFDARIAQVAPVVNAQQGTVEVRLGVPDPPAYLVPDMTVSVNIELASRDAATTLPLDAVRSPNSDLAWVLVVRDGRAERANVKLGVRDTRHVEVLDGISEFDQVVRQPGDVQVGDRLRPRVR